MATTNPAAEWVSVLGSVPSRWCIASPVLAFGRIRGRCRGLGIPARGRGRRRWRPRSVSTLPPEQGSCTPSQRAGWCHAPGLSGRGRRVRAVRVPRSAGVRRAAWPFEEEARSGRLISRGGCIFVWVGVRRLRGGSRRRLGSAAPQPFGGVWICAQVHRDRVGRWRLLMVVADAASLQAGGGRCCVRCGTVGTAVARLQRPAAILP